uniref:Minor capsid protein P8 central region domain-containing protein n=1 Tax=Mimivirus LCMiAC01 TaxID=2506608 RepID=A0A481YZU9_9VIRU|nr:MAG: uncharacterized protein LCMiAC01_04640 [Mimivirus LCMiAC01]
MNYKSFAPYNNKPPYYNKNFKPYYDIGQGIPKLNPHNMTVQDIFRTPHLMLQEHRHDYAGMANDALKGIQANSELSKMYFSDINIKRLQKMIKKEIYKRTNGTFRLDVDQDPSNLFIYMRATYMEHARFLPRQIIRQVKRLNEKVISEITPGMITEIRQYYGYLKEINKPLDPIPLPINVNNAGRQTLPSITTTFGID